MPVSLNAQNEIDITQLIVDPFNEHLNLCKQYGIWFGCGNDCGDSYGLSIRSKDDVIAVRDWLTEAISSWDTDNAE